MSTNTRRVGPRITLVGVHNRGMADIDRRSEDRRARVIVRMSDAERDAIRKAAAERGETINDLVRERLGDLITTGKRTA